MFASQNRRKKDSGCYRLESRKNNKGARMLTQILLTARCVIERLRRNEKRFSAMLSAADDIFQLEEPKSLQDGGAFVR
jgi:hypothetical protein